MPASELGAPAAARPSWPSRLSDRWFGWRNRLLASPSFQRACARWWPLRPIARRNAAAVFDLVAGFVYSQVLAACVRLRLFDCLAQGPQSAPALAARLRLPEAAMQRLLDAAASLRLVERRPGGLWGLGMLGAPLAGNEALRAMVEHHAVLYADLADPVALLRQEKPGQLNAYWSYAAADQPSGLPAQAVERYSRLMSASQPLVAQELLEGYPFGRHRCVLDVGGGDGTFLQALGQRHPGMQRILFDLPAVAQLAAARLGDAAQVVPGDFLRDPLPQGADLVTLVRVLHDHDDASVRVMLSRVRQALPPGGTLVVAEPMSGTPGAEPMGDAYFGFYLLAMGSGRPRRPAELAALMEEAGFGAIRSWPTRFPLQASILTGQRKV